MVPLWPPNPNEFDRVGPGVHGRPSPVTMSISGSSGSRSAKPNVGGSTPWRIDSTTATASMDPAAPSECPVTPLIEVTAGPGVPNSVAIACASAASLSGVEVPWALTWTMSSADSPASSSASCMHATAPEPPGDGAVMWWASAVDAPPSTSARIVAPRASALDHSSSTRAPAPSDIMNPSRRRSNGHDTPVLESAVMLVKPAMPVSVIAASVLPATTASQRPEAIRWKAFATEWVPAAQAVTVVSHGPWNP